MSDSGRLTSFWRQSSLLIRIIIINVLVFLVIRICGVISFFSHGDSVSPLLQFLILPSSFPALWLRPWTTLTYMFTQVDTFHLIFNMLWLYWFGRFFLTTCNFRQLFSLYLIGGLAGAFFYLFFSPPLPLLGSSSAVMAIVAGTAVMNPDLRISLFMFGEIKLKWLAIITITIFALGLSGPEAPSQIAHFGGIVAGVIFGWQMRRGVDITAPLSHLIDLISNAFRNKDRKPSPKSIFDKIKRSGYASLNEEERRVLLEYTRNQSKNHNS